MNNKNENYLVLRLNDSDYFFSDIKLEINLFPYYKNLGRFSKMLLDFRGRLYKLTKYNLNKEWYQNLDGIKTIILFDTGYNKDIGQCIKKKKPKVRLIMYFHNSILKDYQQQILNDPYIDEFWSFDKKDCKRYCLKYNPTFYANNCGYSNECDNDVIFLGRDKGRKNIIDGVEKYFNTNNIKSKIYLIENETQIIPYKIYINELINSKVILDITQNGQSGPSLRFMESLFFEKKIITNNNYIKEYDFYNSNNIFILGEDNIENIKEFIENPYSPLDVKIKEEYTCSSWLKHFYI